MPLSALSAKSIHQACGASAVRLPHGDARPELKVFSNETGLLEQIKQLACQQHAFKNNCDFKG